MDDDAEGLRNISLARYGKLYGPNTGSDIPDGTCTVHVQAAAQAVVLALQNSPGGTFNIADADGDVTVRKHLRFETGS